MFRQHAVRALEYMAAVQAVMRRTAEAEVHVVTFTGQGSQRAGAGKDLLSAFPYVRRIYEEADDTLKMPLSKMIWEGQQAELKQTENAQPAILTHSMAIWHILKEEIGLPSAAWFCCAMLGHSVGEYSALCASDCLTFPDALRLVRSRGQAMRDATAKSSTRTVMAALEPCTPLLALGVCKEAAKQTGGICALACDNSDVQQVISGDERAVLRAMELAKMSAWATPEESEDEGPRGPAPPPPRAVLLEVSGAFHSPCMQPAEEEMRQLIANVPMKEPSVWIIPNTLGRSTRDTDVIRMHLLAQLTHTVRWRSSIRHCTPGTRRFTEIGPAAVFTPMLKRHFLQDDSIVTMPVTKLSEVQQCIKHDNDRT